MISKVIKKNIFLVIISFVAFIMLAIGASYALFFQYDANTTNQIISVGTVDASLSSSTGVLSITNLSPKNYSDLEPNENTYSFTISNTGSYTLQYEVYFTDNTATFIHDCQEFGCQDFSDNPLESSYFNYINYKLDNISSTFSDINSIGKKTIGSGIIMSGEAKTYTIQIWLDSSAPNDVIGKTASFNIKLDALAVDSPIESDKSDVSFGDVVKIGSEEFYVLSNNQNTVRMIAKYNLKVGEDVSNSSTITVDPESQLYNKQDSSSIGTYTPVENNYLYKSVIHYSDSAHYPNQLMCDNLPCYNRYEGSNLQDKINSYVANLRSEYGAEIVGDAPTIEDYNLLKQIPNYHKTSFWTKSNNSLDNANTYTVLYNSDPELVYADALEEYSGVRPIILVNAKNIKKKLNLDNSNITVAVTTLQNNEIVTGSIISIGEEKFYVISSNNGIIRMLAKEVLNCRDNLVNLEDMDIIQETNPVNYDNMLSFSNSQRALSQGTCISTSGTESYCYSSYKNSSIEYCAKLYEDAIYRLYQTSVRVDLPTFIDLKNMDYSSLTKQFKNEDYSWAYSKNYWTKEAATNTNLYVVNNSNNVIEVEYTSNNYGVRPIVIIHESQISNLP